MTTTVTLKIAKLLKEKEYPFEFIAVGEIKEVPLNIPTIAEVVMWLYEKHDIWIHLCYMTDTKNWWWDCYKYKKANGLLNEPCYSNKFNHQTPTEAYLSAIEHTLTNLL